MPYKCRGSYPNRLRDCLDALPMSQAALSRRLGVPAQTINSLATGGRKLDARWLSKLTGNYALDVRA